MAETLTEEREAGESPSPSPAPPKADYGAWGRPSPQWVKWVSAMRSSHHSTWQSAGIFDAIINSTFTIHRRDDLLSALVDKWDPTTNTFAFQRGEATVTLEDVAALGGFSAAGESVSDPPPAEAKKKLSELFGTRLELNASKAKKAARSKWMSKYMGSDNDTEHEAFLAYWLSKFVFPLLSNAIGKEVIPIAVRLAMGARIALAQPLLASIYRALTLLKRGAAGPVKAPLSLLQVWAWERFPRLCPNPNLRASGPRMARWDGLRGGLCTSIDFDGEGFKRRPYGVEMDELVGLERGCIERYMPHRVGMRLGPDGDGLDQDLLASDAMIEEEDLPVGDASIGEEEHGLHAGDATTEEEEEEEEEESWFGLKRTKRSYFKQFRRQRSVEQNCCASNSSEAFEDEEGNHEGVVRRATVDEKIDSSVRGCEEERVRILERLVRLLERGNFRAPL